MGLFTINCAVSGLPIEQGDKLRSFLLTKSPYTDNFEAFYPRSLPIQGVYSGYGDIEGYEENAITRNWLEALKIDLIETGGNHHWDVVVSKATGFPDLLDALQAKRIYVRSKVSFEEETPYMTCILNKYSTEASPTKKKIEPGIPTLRRVSSALSKAGFIVNPKDAWGDSNIVWVGTEAYGRVQVGASSIDSLYKAQSILCRKYATAIMRGNGTSIVLIVGAKASTPGHYPERSPKRLAIAPTFVREDVWQSVCMMCPVGMGLDVIIDSVQADWHRMVNAKDRINVDSLNYKFKVYNSIPFFVGMGTSFELMALDYIAGRMSAQEAVEVILSTAELIYVTQQMKAMGREWLPSKPLGPQIPDWEQHAEFHGRLIQTSLYMAHLNPKVDED